MGTKLHCHPSDQSSWHLVRLEYGLDVGRMLRVDSPDAKPGKVGSGRSYSPGKAEQEN